MQRAKWINDPEEDKEDSPLGTPQFSVRKRRFDYLESYEDELDQYLGSPETANTKLNQIPQRLSEDYVEDELSEMRQEYEQKIQNMKEEYSQKELYDDIMESSTERYMGSSIGQDEIQNAIKEVMDEQGIYDEDKLKDYQNYFRNFEREIKHVPYSEEEVEEIKGYYKELMEERLEVERQKIHSEVYSSLRAKNDRKKSKKKTKEPKVMDKHQRSQIENLKTQILQENEIRLCSEKESWKRELTPYLIEECKAKVKEEYQKKLNLEKQKIQQQGQTELQELIDQVKQDSDTMMQQQLWQIDEELAQKESDYEQQVYTECYEELKKDLEFRLKEAFTSKLKAQLSREIKEELQNKFEKTLKVNSYEELRKEVKQEWDESMENIRKELEKDYKEKLRQLEQEFEVENSREVYQKVEEKAKLREREMNINFLKKVEKLKKDIRKEHQEEYNRDIAYAKELLTKEKSEVARLRSQLNVELKKSAEMRKKELSKVKEQEILLEKKLKSYRAAEEERELKSRISRSHWTKNNTNRVSIPGNSPHREAYETSPQRNPPDTELIEHLPKPLPPPTLASFPESPPLHPKAKSPQRKLLSSYNSSDIVTNLIMRNLEDAKQKAWNLLQETEQPPTIKLTDEEKEAYYKQIMSEETKHSPVQQEISSKSSKYEQLLKKRHGVIEPRKLKKC